MSKNRGGRPTRYRKEFAEKAMKLCRLGAIDVELADFFGIGEATLSRWKKAHREFREALEEGKSQAEAEVAQSLFKRATGFSHPDTKFATHEGKITDAQEKGKHYPPDSLKPLTTRFIEWDKNGKLRVESKDDMKARGLKSPDRADAALGCIMCGSHLTGSITGENVEESTMAALDFSGGFVTGF